MSNTIMKKHTINAMVFKMTGISNNQLAIFSKTTGECLLNLIIRQDQTMSRVDIFGLFKELYNMNDNFYASFPNDNLPEGLLGVISPTGKTCIFTRNHYERVDAGEGLYRRALQPSKAMPK